ncbi:DDE family transposase [Salegentibacter sp. 24]|jgi:hypothetical protein|nr:DDE family transposase [Salegentibacter sp. 24]
MKNVLMTMLNKILLLKRSVIETINDQLKNICQAEHSRHRSFGNFITNLVVNLIAYSAILSRKKNQRLNLKHKQPIKLHCFIKSLG